MRGLLGKKLGMTQVFDEESGVVTSVTVIEAGPCPVVAVRTPDVDGYEAVQLAYEPVAERKVSKAERGQVVIKPGTSTPHTEFEGQVYILSKDEGGRHTPFFNNYRPQFYFRTTDVTGHVTLPAGTEMIMPGDNAAMDVELITPIAMEEKQRFAIREGGKTVGAGVVVSITE